MTLDPNSEAIAQRTAEIVLEALRAGPLAPAAVTTSEVLTRTEAMAYVKKNSEGAFCEWCKKWGVKAANRGRYNRTRLDVALDREARKSA
jgi:hypothetical protein